MHTTGSTPSFQGIISIQHGYMEWFIGLWVYWFIGLDYMLTHTHFYNLASDVWHLEEGL